MKKLDDIINSAIKETLSEKGIVKKEKINKVINESYVTQAGTFDLKTELLSDKTKKSHQELLKGYTETLNKISANLDAVDKSSSNPNMSVYRALKIDETYNHNAAFLHGLYFENISDINSNLSMDSLSYMHLSRDFGSFDEWQQDFVACCLSSRNGWAITAYNIHLQRYVNTIIDLHSDNTMIGLFPIVVMDCWEHSYYRDYLKDRKSYVFGMMKELNWEIIENRIKKANAIAKVLKDV